MKLDWNEIRPIVLLAGNNGKKFLSVVDEQGDILFTNVNMKKELSLKSAVGCPSNLFELLHPFHIENFRSAFNHEKNNQINELELFVKNGKYHPMKWQVQKLSFKNNGKKTFICLGNYLSDTAASQNIISDISNKDEKIFKVLLNNVSDLIWVLDEASCLIKANRSFLDYSD